MTDVKEAIKSGREYLISIYDPSELRNFLVEEVELTEDGRYWNITYGFDTNSPTRGSLGSDYIYSRDIKPEYIRAYKILKISAEDGTVKSMKIRQV